MPLYVQDSFSVSGLSCKHTFNVGLLMIRLLCFVIVVVVVVLLFVVCFVFLSDKPITFPSFLKRNFPRYRV